MGLIEHWKLMADWVMPVQGGPAQPLTIVIGPPIPPGEKVEVVRADAYQGAVEALGNFIAEVAAPTGRLRLEGHDEGDVLYEAMKRARAAYTGGSRSIMDVLARSMTTVLAEILRATYHDEMPADAQTRISGLVREAVALNRQHPGAVEERDRLRAAISWARGMCTDEAPHPEIDAALGRALDPTGGQ